MAHILLAEDDISMAAFLTQALERAGHRVTAKTDGLKAMEAFEDAFESNDSIDLLLADIVMPGMDGIELAQKARKRHPGLKVMFITGFAAVAMGENAHQPAPGQPAPRVLSKPFHLGDLVAQVEAALAEPPGPTA
jgi:two-component system cell cycle response regulator CpdR